MNHVCHGCGRSLASEEKQVYEGADWCSDCHEDARSPHDPLAHSAEAGLNGSADAAVWDRTAYAAPPSAAQHSVPFLTVAGGVILVLGGLLWIGNVTGVFPTFSGAGYITMIVGGLIMKAGG